MTCILVIDETNSRNRFKRYYFKKTKHFLKILFHFWNLQKILRIFKKRDQLHSLNICQISDAEKGAYFNGRKLLF